VALSVNPCPVGAALPVPPKLRIRVPVVRFAATNAARIALTADADSILLFAVKIEEYLKQILQQTHQFD